MQTEECTIIKNHEGYLVNSCTGEVVDFDNYDATDYSNLEYYEKVSSSKKKEAKKEIRDTKEIVLSYLLSIMSDEEKDMFYKILQKVGEKKLDASFYLAIYEYILEREGKVVTRDYIRFLRTKGVGRYAIRQKKKLLRHVIKEDPVLHYIDSLNKEKREEALKLYEILKKKNLVYGRAETRKKILLEYLNDEEKKKRVLEEYYVEELIKWNFNHVTVF